MYERPTKLRKQPMVLNSVFKREDFIDPRRLVSLLLFATAISITGPFGTYYLSFPIRASYWSGWLIAIWLPTTLTFLIVHRAFRFSAQIRMLKSLAVFLVSIPLAAICAVTLASFYFPEFPLTFSNLVAEASVLWPVTLGIVALLHFTHDFGEEMGKEELVKTKMFFDRLPQSLGQNILTISSADHYVQVRTEMGEALVLLSLKRAEEELEHYNGLRIHRGHWVAIDAVVQKVWRDARLFLRLKDGSELPVGRSYRAQVLKQI
jgi:DNA-binding LytR/AlgR family response regulator